MVVVVLAEQFSTEVLVLDLLVVHLGLKVHVVVDLVLELVLTAEQIVAEFVLEFGVLLDEFLDLLVAHRDVAVLHDVLHGGVPDGGRAGCRNLFGRVGAVLSVVLGGVERAVLLVLLPIHHLVIWSAHSELLGLLLHIRS